MGPIPQGGFTRLGGGRDRKERHEGHREGEQSARGHVLSVRGEMGATPGAGLGTDWEDNPPAAPVARITTRPRRTLTL